MSDESREDGLDHFPPTGGRVHGVVGLVMAAGFLGMWALDRDDVPDPLAAAALVGGVLFWAALLRPRVSVSRETLHLRNMLETVHLPLAAIDELVVGHVLMLRVGDKKFVSPAIGRKPREVRRVARPGPTTVDYVDHVEGRLRSLVADARTRHGVGACSDETKAPALGVRRDPAWPEIVALGAAILLFVLTLVAGIVR